MQKPGKGVVSSIKESNRAVCGPRYNDVNVDAWHLHMEFSEELVLRSISHNGETGSPSEETGHHTKNDCTKEADKDRVIEDDEKIQAQATAWIEDALDDKGKNDEHVQHAGLHGVEPHVPPKTRVTDHGQIEGEEDYEVGEGDAGVEAKEREEGAEKNLRHRVLGKDIASILHSVQQREQVAHRCKNTLSHSTIRSPRRHYDYRPSSPPKSRRPSQ